MTSFYPTSMRSLGIFDVSKLRRHQVATYPDPVLFSKLFILRTLAYKEPQLAVMLAIMDLVSLPIGDLSTVIKGQSEKLNRAQPIED